MTAPSHRRVVPVGDRRLTVARWGDEPVGAVLLHDGLGSIAQWGDVPARIAAATGTGVIAYDRAGHGISTPAPTGAWPVDWLHREADVLGRLLAALAIEEPLLVGHSDGGSIALLHAAAGGQPCSGVVAIAAHTFVEPVCVDAIEAMRSTRDRYVAGLARSHAAPAALFEAWSGVWTDPEFRTWDARPLLAAITAPVLVVQGDADEYATDAQLTETARAIGGSAEVRRLHGVGHVVHRSAPDTVVEIVGEAHRRTAGATTGTTSSATTG